MGIGLCIIDKSNLTSANITYPVAVSFHVTLDIED